MPEKVFLDWAENSQGLWNGVPQNEDLSNVFNDETTPVKACGDFAYNVNNSGKTLVSDRQFDIV